MIVQVLWLHLPGELHSIHGYFPKGALEADGHWQIAAIVILAEEGGLSQFPRLMMLDLSALKMPETEGLGTERCFLGASEDESRLSDEYFLHCL